MTPSNGTYQQPGCRRAPRTLVRNEKGQFVAKGGEYREEGHVSAAPIKEEADALLKVIEALTGYDRERCLTSREYPLPIYRAAMYERLWRKGFSSPRIGEAFRKDHCTVLHGLKMIREAKEVGEKDVVEICQNIEIELQKPKTKTNENMGKLYFTTISFAGGLRKVEKELWPTMADTFRNAIVEEEQLESLKANLEESVKTRAEELKVKPVTVALSPEFDKLKGASLPRFLSVGRITVTFTEVRHIIGKDTKETDA